MLPLTTIEGIPKSWNLGGLLGPFSLGLMGFGAGLNAFSALKQGKQIARDLQDQALEIERRAGFEAQLNLEQQGLLTDEESRAIGSAKASAAKAGVRTGTGSPVTLRESILSRYERQRRLMNMQSAEIQTRYHRQAAELDREARRVKRQSKWKAFADILGGAANIGISAFTMGIL